MLLCSEDHEIAPCFINNYCTSFEWQLLAHFRDTQWLDIVVTQGAIYSFTPLFFYFEDLRWSSRKHFTLIIRALSNSTALLSIFYFPTLGAILFINYFFYLLKIHCWHSSALPHFVYFWIVQSYYSIPVKFFSLCYLQLLLLSFVPFSPSPSTSSSSSSNLSSPLLSFPFFHFPFFPVFP